MAAHSNMPVMPVDPHGLTGEGERTEAMLDRSGGSDCADHAANGGGPRERLRGNSRAERVRQLQEAIVLIESRLEAHDGSRRRFAQVEALRKAWATADDGIEPEPRGMTEWESSADAHTLQELPPEPAASPAQLPKTLPTPAPTPAPKPEVRPPHASPIQPDEATESQRSLAPTEESMASLSAEGSIAADLERHRTSLRIAFGHDGQGRASMEGLRVVTGWPFIDRLFGGGLPWRGLHEWVGVCGASSPEHAGEAALGRSVGTPSPAGQTGLAGGPALGVPLGVLIALAHQACRSLDRATQEEWAGESARGIRPVLWIGRHVWPHPRALMAGVRAAWERAWWGGDPSDIERGEESFATEVDESLLRRSILVDPEVHPNGESEAGGMPTSRSRGGRRAKGVRGRGRGARSGVRDTFDCGLNDGTVWAIEQAIRSPDVAVVVADGSGLSMAATRRLHLAMLGRSTPQLVLLARPPTDAASLSAALTRWQVTPAMPRAPSASGLPVGLPAQLLWDRSLWSVQLMRCKATLVGMVARAGHAKPARSVIPSESPGALSDGVGDGPAMGARWEAGYDDRPTTLAASATPRSESLRETTDGLAMRERATA